MKITLEKPESFQGIGRKENQEDSFVMSSNGRFFVLCDGMGGHENGEVASGTVCAALSDFFTKTPPENYNVSTEYLNRAVEYAYQKLDEQDAKPDSIKKMGTTLTCVYFGDNGVLVAHTGDSRVYQIRPMDYSKEDYRNAVKIETKDHSLVRQLIDIGEISESEAKTHPKRNVITKCMQPHDDYDMPDFDSCEVKTGDYFFLCSDGVLENITSEILCEVLSKDIADKEKIAKIQSYCDGKTRDNYTCILLRVKSGELDRIDLPSEPVMEIETFPDDAPIANTHQQSDNPPVIETKPSASSLNIRQIYSKTLILLLVLAGLLLVLRMVCGVGKAADNRFDEKINDYKATHTRTPLGMEMYLFSQKNEFVLVNEKAKKIFNLTDSNGKILLKTKNSVLNGRKIKATDFKIHKFSCDSVTKDTVAKIELTLEKGKKAELKINSNGEIKR